MIKLKQGFGRLIRTQHDTGMVVILDPRVRTKPYGKVFSSFAAQVPAADRASVREGRERRDEGRGTRGEGRGMRDEGRGRRDEG